MSNKRKGNPWALLPIGVFLIIFLGAGILTGDFNTMPAIVGFLIALSIAFCQNRKVDFQRKLTIISRGIGEENIVTMCLIFLAAGAFSGTISAAGGVESTVNLGLSIMPALYSGDRPVCHRLLYLRIYGDFCGDHHRYGAYRSRDCPGDRPVCAALPGGCGLRRHVRG